MFKKIKIDSAMLLIVDVQEKLLTMLNKRTVEDKTALLAKFAKTLNLPAIVTEQYPAGLGETSIKIKANLPISAKFYEKTSFSAFETESVRKQIEIVGRKQVILCGIESHICVLQTAIDMLNAGFEVFIVKDACASRNKYEFKTAMERLQSAGAILTCTEMVLFELLGNAKNPFFKELQTLIK